VKLVSQIMQYYSRTGQETNTTFDFKKILKLFVRWINTGQRLKVDNDLPDPESIRWIKLKKVRNNIAREDLLTEQDRTRLIHACKNQRDRAFIDVHLEAGTRPAEILSLSIKHVLVDDLGAIIKVDGKTGQRQIRIVRSVKHLTDWLNVHPFKDNPEAPLFLSIRGKTPEKLSYISARGIIRSIATKANLQKRVYLKLFRHSEITRAITDLNFNEEMLKKRHGWTPDSKMASVYVHAVNEDANKAYLRGMGIEPKVEQKDQMFKMCSSCNHRNNSDVDFCEFCSKPLELKRALEADRERNEKMKFLEDKFAELTKSMKEKDEKNEEFRKGVVKMLNKIAHNYPSVFHELHK
ncbi:MAG: tyrosine-type recombinase/integrase, partial [Candidatus Nitrosotenuis sp.]